MINYKKLKEAMTELTKIRKTLTIIPFPEKANMPPPEYAAQRKEYYRQFDVMTDRGYATALYSLRAHLRGRLHMTKKYVPTKNGDGCLDLIYWTFEDQAKLVAPLMAQFEYTESEMNEREVAFRSANEALSA